MIVCAGKNEQFVFAKTIGVGFTHAAISTTKICIEKNPKTLLFVGTAGSYGNVDILNLFCSSRATNLEIGNLLEKSYSPIDSSVKLEIPSFVSRETFSWLNVNSSNYITSNENISKKFLAKSLDAENMEFYGFLEAAKRFGIPAFGFFAVTNFCNKNAHEDFLKNHKDAKNLLSEMVEKHFRNFI